MLRERYSVDNLFEEIAVHFPKVDPILATIDGYLEDEQLYQLIKADLTQRRPKTLETGRNSTPVEVALRMLVVKRLYQYSYGEIERYVSDSLVLRRFCPNEAKNPNNARSMNTRIGLLNAENGMRVMKIASVCSSRRMV